MEVRVLGPLMVTLGNGQRLELGGRRGPLLALLALASGPVRRAELVPLVAEDEPTAFTDRLLDFHLDALQRSLGAHRLHFDEETARLDLREGELDAADFEREAGAGLAAVADGDAATGAALLHSTLARWQGDVLEGMAVPGARGALDHLRELRELAETALASAPRAGGGEVIEAGSVQTFLMTDVVGSTKLWEEQPTSMAVALERHDALIAGAVRRSGGSFLKHRMEGDSTFSVFGSPADAVGAAVAMQRALRSVVWPDGLEITVRASVYTGESIERGGDYYGPTVNRAARLRSLARGGQVLVSAMTAGLIADALPGETRLVTQGFQALRGVPRPEEVFAIADLRVSLPEVAASEQMSVESNTGWLGLASPLVGASTAFTGRASEFERLLEALGSTAHGQQVVFIGGDPGIGKTRLTAELARHAHDKNALVLFGREASDHVIPYRAFVRAFDAAVRAAPTPLLERYVAEYGSELVRLVPALNRRLPWLTTSQATDPAVERHSLFEAVYGLFEHLCSASPVVMMIDDIHDASDDTIAMLRYLMDAGAHLPLLITATFRDSEVEADSELGHVLTAARRSPSQTILTVTGLTTDDLSVLASDVLGAASSILAQTLASETGGNPLFAIELMRGGYDLIMPGDSVRRSAPRVPETVRDVIMRRVERLGDDVTRTLVMAAVAGNEFELSVVSFSLGGNEEQVLARIEQAIDAHLVVESTEPGRFVFSHGLVGHSLQASLSQTRLARAHLAVADAIETVWGTASPGLVEEIATHLLAAGPSVPAERLRDACRRAGDRALDQLAPEQAIRWYDLVVELSDDELQRCDALVALGGAQRQGGIPQFRETLLRAAHIAEAAGDNDRLLEAAVSNHRGDRTRTYFVDAERVRVLRSAIAAAGSRPSPLRAKALALLALETTHDPDWQTRIEVSDDALADARELGDVETLCEVYRLRFEAIRLPDTLQTRAIDTVAYLDAAESLGDPLHLAFAHVWRSRACLELGDVEGLDHHFAVAEELSERVREPFLRWNVSAHHAYRALMRGDLDASEAAAYRCAEIAKSSGQPDAGAVLGDHLLAILDARGRAPEQAVYLERGLERVPESSALRATLAYIVAVGGDHDDATLHIDRLVTDGVVDVLRDLTWMASMSYLARAIVIVGHRTAARAVYDQLVPWGDQVVWSGASTHGPMHLYLGPLAALLDEPDVALDHARRALETSRSMGAPLWVATSLVTIAQLSDGDERQQLASEASSIASRHGFARIERVLGELDQPQLSDGGH